VLGDEQLVILGASPDAQKLAAWGPRVLTVNRPQAVASGRDAEAPEGVAARAPRRMGGARGFTVCVPGAVGAAGPGCHLCEQQILSRNLRLLGPQDTFCTAEWRRTVAARVPPGPSPLADAPRLRSG
jgi:hypothetical protein